MDYIGIVHDLWLQLLGDEVYHYHAKLIMKDANTGGAHIWHQDYGYVCIAAVLVRER